MPVPLPNPEAAPHHLVPVPNTAHPPRARRARPPDLFSAPSELRPAVAVGAEISADGKDGQFERSRAQVLRWLEAHVGPLPPGFHRGVRDSQGGVHDERRRSAGAIVRATEKGEGSNRYFGASIEAGAVAGLAAWTTNVLLFRAGETSHLYTLLLAPRRRLQARSAALWVPAIVRWLAHSPGLTDYGWRLLPAPWIIQNEDDVEALIQLIGNPKRVRPVFAIGLFPRETNPESAPLDPWDLAHRTVGLAHVVVLTGPMTYALTDRVGRKYSVFGNAIRTYRPGCSIESHATEHPMALPETVRRWRNGGPHEFADFLTREAARTSVARQRARDIRLPESLNAPCPEVNGSALVPDPFGDGDSLHPVGAGSDEPVEDRSETAEPKARAG